MQNLNAIHGRLKRMAYRLLLPAVRSSCRCWNGGEGDAFGFLCRRSDLLPHRSPDLRICVRYACGL